MLDFDSRWLYGLTSFVHRCCVLLSSALTCCPTGMVLLSEDDEVQATGCRGGWLGGWWGELAWLCDRVAGWLQCTAHALLGSWCGL